MAASDGPGVADRGAVVGGDQREAEAGVEMLRAGGNAVDAVVAAAFAGYVVEPWNCGVGGHGRLAAHLVERGRTLIVDGFTIAPLRARPDMYAPIDGEFNSYGWPIVEGRHNERGHLSVVVPGAVACLCTAHARLGRLPLRRVMAPAIDLARAGLAVDARLAGVIRAHETEIRRFPATAAWLLPRVHCQGNETYVDERVPATVRDELAERGHHVVVQAQTASTNNFGRVAALHRTHGIIHCGADPPGAMGAPGLLTIRRGRARLLKSPGKDTPAKVGKRRTVWHFSARTLP